MNKKLLKGKIMNIKRIIVLVLISASSGLLCAQRKTVNMSDRYGILTVTPLDKYTGAASLLKTNGVRSLTDVSYGDGFGGVSQKIHVGITPQGKDLTESYEYNSLGNLQSRTLPVPVLSEGASGNYKQILKSAQEYYGHSNVCSRFAYEASHRSLLLKEFGVGDEWTGKAVSKKYSCNLESIPAQRCKRYLVSDGGELVESDSPYADGSLRGIRSEDEDGNQIYVFHAYATKNLGSVNAAGRDMFVRRVHWAADGMPVFDMSSSEELASKTVSVTVKVVDDTVTVDKTDLSKALASAKQLRESDYTAASWKAFAAALASAEKVYADENASQKDVDDATAALNKAQAALVKVDGSDSGDGSSDSTKPGDGSSIDAGATGDKTGNKLGLSKTGAAVLGLSGVAVALAAAGIALTLQRKRQA